MDRVSPALGREDLRDDGEELRALGQQVLDLSDELALMAQTYRDLYERLRVLHRWEEAPETASPRMKAKASRPGPRGVAGVRPPAHGSSKAEPPRPTVQGERNEVRRSLYLLLDRQGELGRKMMEISRHPLFSAGGEEPRKIRAHLLELANRCQGLRLSSETVTRSTERSLSALLDDLCEMNSGAREDLFRYGHGLRARGEGILSGRKEDRRYLQGDAWRRPLL